MVRTGAGQGQFNPQVQDLDWTGQALQGRKVFSLTG